MMKHFREFLLKYKKSLKYDRKEAFKIINNKDKGLCLISTKKLRKGYIIGEYTGEILNFDEFDSRCKNIYKPNKMIYTFELSNNTYIDATYYGNYTRFIEHSCNPNCIVLERKNKLIVKSLKSIKKGDYITISYVTEASSLENHTFICKCGYKNCIKYV